MNRIDHLNTHLHNLIAANQEGDYYDDIKNTVAEINKELGIGEKNALSSYSTKELLDELSKRVNVKEFLVNLEQEVVISVLSGEYGQDYSFKGPVRILINQD